MFSAFAFQQTMTKTASSPKSFESAISELERIVQEMEAGTITLEESLDRYQRGVGLLNYCQNTLQSAEQKLLQLEGDTLTPRDTKGAS